jgi:hypothetical protein
MFKSVSRPAKLGKREGLFRALYLPPRLQAHFDIPHDVVAEEVHVNWVQVAMGDRPFARAQKLLERRHAYCRVNHDNAGAVPRRRRQLSLLVTVCFEQTVMAVGAEVPVRPTTTLTALGAR